MSSWSELRTAGCRTGEDAKQL